VGGQEQRHSGDRGECRSQASSHCSLTKVRGETGLRTGN
jgi:hypothetical protein